jgi:hypothetical protein
MTVPALKREPHSSFKSPVEMSISVFSLLWIRMNSSSWFPLAGLASTFREGKAGAAGLAGGNERIVVIEKNISTTIEIAVEGVYTTA